jgi:uncharacterized repeat protein (TIGR03837 family)
MQIDIFCKIIDNFGDIGVCWRLAKQLTQEYHHKVRLFVDDLNTFKQLRPQVNIFLSEQVIDQIQILNWTKADFKRVHPGQVVIEAFACDIPEDYIFNMSRLKSKPTWINIEYLSAEAWTEEIHKMPSPHPHYALKKYFFVPGFLKATGGLLRENSFLPRIQALKRSPELQRQIWVKLGLRPPRDNEFQIFLFCYDKKIISLLQELTQWDKPVRLLVPPGKPTDSINKSWGKPLEKDGRLWWGSLEIEAVPFVEPDFFDEILSQCDFAIIRGEDSFVRVQHLGVPFLWNIYPQDDNAHRIKMLAFLKLYKEHMSEDLAEGLERLWIAFDAEENLSKDIKLLSDRYSELKMGADSWARALAQQTQLTQNLLEFIEQVRD